MLEMVHIYPEKIAVLRQWSGVEALACLLNIFFFLNKKMKEKAAGGPHTFNSTHTAMGEHFILVSQLNFNGPGKSNLYSCPSFAQAAAL